jgi:hypothetical protein
MTCGRGVDHVYSMFFDPETQTWRAYVKQLELLNDATMDTEVGFFFYRPGFDLTKFCHLCGLVGGRVCLPRRILDCSN